MKKPLDYLKRFRRSYTDMVGIDVGSSAIKIVRLRKANHTIALLGAEILPAPALPATAVGGSAALPAALELPKALRGRYVLIATSAAGTIVKLLNVPTQAERAGELQINELLGIPQGAHYRVAYEVVGEGHTRSESRLLAVAMPEDRAQALCALFPVGIPAPCAIELAGLAAMQSFRQGPGRQHTDDCVAVVDFGAVSSFLAIFNKGALVLLRKFDAGSNTILNKIQESLGVDRETAQGILSDGSFDVSQLVRDAVGALSQQIIISRDFVERRESCHIQKLYVTGGVTGARDWQNELRTALGVPPELWNPFDGLQVAEGALPEHLTHSECRFAAAVGSAIASLSET